MTILAPILHLVIALDDSASREQQAFYFLAAFGGLLVGVLLAALPGVMTWSPPVSWSEYGLQIGSCWKSPCCRTLAHRLKLAHEANERLQKPTQAN